ncbi:BnaC09g53080D [Brassica napus]|uniref:BnaC09g53080D protein n=1 Tax=Brassica napus TaxID=3708 RepID=A0A078JCC9_BRANA|nr:BnaC09g53080D [Brassica napus]
MNDERVDLIIDMYIKKYDWSKHVWGYQETEQPYADSSEDDRSKEEEAGERSDCGMEEEIETAHVSPAKKRKNQYQDIGAESRKKRLLCQRSTDKYRDLEEGMKSYIHGMFKSSFTALGLEVRDLIEDRFTKLEQTILSSQTPVGTHGAAPAYTQTHGAAPAYTQTHAAATTSTQAPGSDSTLSPTPTLASTHASAPATTSRARASRNKASVPSHTGGPATAAKTRSQTKDPELSDVFGSLFDTIDFNLGTQEHVQKTMSKLTQESYVKGFDPSQEIFNRPFLNDIDDPEVRCKDSDYELVFVPEDKFSKLTEWILKPK